MKLWHIVMIMIVAAGGCAPLRGLLPAADPSDRLAASVTIVRDEWGVPHILAESDAAAAFGLGYVQAEDDLHALEDEHLHALGRASHWYGEQYLAADLVRRAFEVERLAREEYDREPPERRAVWDAFAAGINYYIGTSAVSPRLITRYEPWMPFALARDVSAGMVIDGVRLGRQDAASALRTGLVGEVTEDVAPVVTGSWVRAAAPSRAAGGSALLLESEAGPFTRGMPYEALVHSDEGWHVRGRLRPGTPIPLSGHNSRIAWGVAPDGADHADAYEVTFDNPSDPLMYRFDGSWRSAVEWVDTVHVNTANGVVAHAVRFRRTHHGPLVAARDGGFLAVRVARHVEGGALQQLMAMGRAQNLDEFRRSLEEGALAAAVIYADVDGSIFHQPANAVPARDASIDASRALDGASAAADWRGYVSAAELGPVANPARGWVATADAPAAALPAGDTAWAHDTWQAAAFDAWIPRAGDRIETLVWEWEQVGGRNATRARRLDGAIELLRTWDQRADTASEAATLYVLWQERARERLDTGELAAFRALEGVVTDLERAWGRVAVAWGDVNRLRAPAGQAEGSGAEADSAGVAVHGAPGWAGSAFVFAAAPTAGAGRRFGESGTRWIGAVELAAAPSARSIVPFGQGRPGTPHGFDQAPLYVTGRLKDARFSRDAVLAAARRTYRPVDVAVRELP